MIRIEVHGLGKDYRFYDRPWHRLWEAVVRRPRHRLFTALDEVSFTVLTGTSLGIIGDNGAGKSTLLKLLVGTLSPSRGFVRTSGRVTALLELGAGFHPDFTGRQNIYLNATLLGLSPADIRRLEPSIIGFSELDDFIDRPVRTYSSGMVVRLAFSIAVSVQPDILVIDEALAVGDVAFQRKCVERMLQFRTSGKTLVFCSHSMYHIQELCHQVLWLHRGKIKRFGDVQEVLAAYEEHCRTRALTSNPPDDPFMEGSAAVSETAKDCLIRSLWVENAQGNPVMQLHALEDLVLVMDVLVLKDGARPQFGFAFVEPDGAIVAGAVTHHDHVLPGPYDAGQLLRVRLHIGALPVRPGTYRLTAAVADKGGLLWYEAKHLYPVQVLGGKTIGRVVFRRRWHVETADEPSAAL